MTAAVLASARTDVAGYLDDLIYVYILLIFAYIILNWIFAFGWRPAYSRTFDAVATFLREVVEPYLRIFRRVLPSFGGLDLSPIVATFVLILVDQIVVRGIIHG